MSPDPKDYGQEGDATALVPGSLVVYRHFQVDLEAGTLLPMNYRPPRRGRYHPPEFRDSRYRIFGDHANGTYTAECIKVSPSAYMAHAFKVGMGFKHEKSPTVWCTCGFYAHYDPETDFYPSHRWGRLYNRLAGTEELANLVVVRAVCEVSGTVIMGTLGVRAEKVKILAFGIDWAKRIQPSAVDRYNFEQNRRYAEWMESEGAPLGRGQFSRKWGPDEVEDDAFVVTSVERVAQSYGVKHYGRVSDMYADYPKPDVSALVEEQPEPEPVPEQWEFGFDTTPIGNAPVNWGRISTVKEVLGDIFGTQIALYSQGVKFDTRRARGPSPTQVWVDELMLPSSEATQFERVMLKKRNKSAPPGTGIDRRRGKLR